MRKSCPGVKQQHLIQRGEGQLQCSEPGSGKDTSCLQSAGLETVAAGDSFNDLDMIRASRAGFLFRTTEAIRRANPDLPALESYDEFLSALLSAIGD